MILRESEGGQKTWICMNSSCKNHKNFFKGSLVLMLLLLCFAGCGNKCEKGSVKIDGKCYEVGGNYFRNSSGKENLT
jgi:hypothetical protein